MQPILIIVLAVAASVPLGLWLRRSLATLSYRNADEADLPEPGPRWWVVWASILAIGSLAAAAALSPEPLAYLPLVPLAATGPWLAAVDFDVLRIPHRALVPAAAATLLAIVGVATATWDCQVFLAPLAAAAATGAVFAAVHLATKGGIGFGDVKLAALIGLAVGPLGVGTVWLAALTGSLAALLRVKAEPRVGPMPYGPWLLGGSWLAAITVAFAG